MKKKLLSLFAVLYLSTISFAQTTAYDAPDIFQCGNEVFDLTLQNSIILGNQDPLNFSVTYYLSEQNAIEEVNPITDPTFYIAPWEQVITIYARVTYSGDSSYDISEFQVGFGSTYVPQLNDVTACNSYTLAPLDAGNYYTGPNGSGTLLPVGTTIVNSSVIYVYSNWENYCFAETSFTLTINNLMLPELDPLVACDPDNDGTAIFDLALILEQLYPYVGTQTSLTVHETMADATTGTNAIPTASLYNYTNVTLNQTIYIRADNGMCWEIIDVQLIAGECNTNLISGNVRYDINNDGCDSNDPAAAGVQVQYTYQNDIYTTYTNSNGDYVFYNIPDGNINVYVNNPSYTSVPAVNQIVTPSITTGVDFCLATTSPVHDVAVSIFPMNSAIPGMAASYVIVYQNLGSYPEEVFVNFEYDPVLLTYLASSPVMQDGTPGYLSMGGVTLQPFQSQYVYVTFSVAQPPVAQSGDVITLNAFLDVSVDGNWTNNDFELNQVIVNSYDPNDIRVHEGETITLAQASDYLHYTIRFQNEGTANAQNIRIESMLDANLDPNTFEPVAASHNYVVQRVGDEVNFIFNNIDLPFADADEAGSQGWVTYRVKPVAGAAEGDSMEASAGIYFDFNEAIITNTVTTTIQEVNGTQQFTQNGFVMYPNPANGVVNVSIDNLSGTAQLTVTDVLGKTVINQAGVTSNTMVDISALKSGIYFVKINAQGKSATQKLIVN